MAKLKRLTNKNDNLVVVESPLSDSEKISRTNDYDILTPKQFRTKYRGLLFTTVEFLFKGQPHSIQFNFCTNPFCKWHGLPQTKFDVKSKPSRYKLDSSGENKRLIKCNPDPIGLGSGAVLDTKTATVSNWSVAQEIERLVRIGSVKDIEPDYQFHKEDCTASLSTPFNEPQGFYKRGKSTGYSQRYQCKICKKFTNVLPDQRNSLTYHQQRSTIMPMFAKLLLNRTPVTRTCEILGIGRGTYYDKLELLYKRCLEFLEKYEAKAFAQKKFKEIWVNTDKMTYHLNNVRKKGQGGNRYDGIEEPQFPTNVLVSADLLSRYAFRSDVAYDWDITTKEILMDTLLFKEDHLSDFAKKHGRFGDFSHYPQQPSKNDTQLESEYFNEKSKMDRRERYIDGLHVHSTYTAIAHF